MSLISNKISPNNGRRVSKKMPLSAHVDNRGNLKQSAAGLVEKTKVAVQSTRYPTARSVYMDRMQQQQLELQRQGSYPAQEGAYSNYVYPSQEESPREVTVSGNMRIPTLNTSALSLPEESPRVREPRAGNRNGRGGMSMRGQRMVNGADSFTPQDIQLPDDMDDRAKIQHKVSQREKQLNLGKQTQGYRNYLTAVPKECRDLTNEDHVNTPRATWDISKRRFDELTRHWRRVLHNWDEAPVQAGVQGVVSPLHSESLSPDHLHASEQSIPNSSFAITAEPYTSFLNASSDEGHLDMANLTTDSAENYACAGYEEFEKVAMMPPLPPLLASEIPQIMDVASMTPIQRAVDPDVSVMSLYDMAEFDCATDLSLSAPSDGTVEALEEEELVYFMNAIA